uniref:Pro-thyrotropin-releasing hormone n=1 Tax=Jaculus jaculus TaxID=51337 RepID=A0A8C5P5B4_JACJA
MSGPWVLLALTLILTGVPGGCAQPEEGAQEEAVENALSLADRLLQKDLQRVRGDLGEALGDWCGKSTWTGRRVESLIPLPSWIYKRQHPGKREKAEKEGQASLLPDFVQEVKRQHPGRRSPWMKYPAIKRQHPGRSLVDPIFQGSWEEEEEGEDTLMPEKRQHPGKRAPCGPQETCSQVGHLFGLLDDLRGQEKKHWPKQASWVREPLEV